MPDQRLTGASRSELHTKFEQMPMILGHITLMHLWLFVQKDYVRNRVTDNQHFTLTSRKNSDVEEEKKIV